MNDYYTYWEIPDRVIPWIIIHEGDINTLREFIKNLKYISPEYKLLSVEEIVKIKIRIDIDGEV